MRLPFNLSCLDLFCCQGGAGMGYHQAGMRVRGVDIKPQPRYPFQFTQGDAMDYLKEYGRFYTLIHASPPCQGYSHLTPAAHKNKYPKLIEDLRKILWKLDVPYVIENVEGAKNELRDPVMLCGSMFGLRTVRRRWFETSFKLTAPEVKKTNKLPLLVTTASKASRAKRKALGLRPKSVKHAPLAYGIDWMTFEGLKECIPPAYTRWIAKQFILQL